MVKTGLQGSIERSATPNAPRSRLVPTRSCPTYRGVGMSVLQKHAARRLRYDFGLQMEGVLRSWAIPKGPSADPCERRLAVMVEDLRLNTAISRESFRKAIMGAGAVIVWNRGEYDVIDPAGADAGEAMRKGAPSCAAATPWSGRAGRKRRVTLHSHRCEVSTCFPGVHPRRGYGRPSPSPPQQPFAHVAEVDMSSGRYVCERVPMGVTMPFILHFDRDLVGDFRPVALADHGECHVDASRNP
jgi:DNA ligase D-like protein (predicted 3'-phosphoesterase)